MNTDNHNLGKNTKPHTENSTKTRMCRKNSLTNNNMDLHQVKDSKIRSKTLTTKREEDGNPNVDLG